MSTVCILGAGELGGAVAHALASGGVVRRIRLIDDAAAVAAGKALDIQQAGAIERSAARLDGRGDLEGTAADVYVVADRVGRPPREWAGEDGLALLSRIAALGGRAPIVFAGVSQTSLMLATVRDVGLGRMRVLGSAPEAMRAGARALVALEAGCAPSEVSLLVLGVPGGFVVPWGDASIGGRRLDRALGQVQQRRLEAQIQALWPPGPFALGLAAARTVEALLRSARRTLGVTAVLDGEFGVRGRVGVLPALLADTGLAGVRLPELETRERVRLDNVLAREDGPASVR
jgi:malate/lactate dehydrogenase